MVTINSTTKALSLPKFWRRYCYYEPDFVAVASSGIYYLIETKGREDIDVANKDRAAILWCENATRLTETEWQYVKVPQKEFEKLQPDEFADVLVFAPRALI